MDREQALEVGLALNHIAAVLDDKNLAKVEPELKKIEEICLEAMGNKN